MLFNRKSGQGMTEYIIIIVLVAVLVLGVVLGFGKRIKNIFFNSSNAVENTTSEAEGMSGTDGPAN